MKEVIEHGWNKYRGTCFTCGCKFTYELEDIIGFNVVCPDCGSYVTHYPSEHTRNSLIEDKQDE